MNDKKFLVAEIEGLLREMENEMCSARCDLSEENICDTRFLDNLRQIQNRYFDYINVKMANFNNTEG